jgi:hypothetical protein
VIGGAAQLYRYERAIGQNEEAPDGVLLGSGLASSLMLWQQCYWLPNGCRFRSSTTIVRGIFNLSLRFACRWSIDVRLDSIVILGTDEAYRARRHSSDHAAPCCNHIGCRCGASGQIKSDLRFKPSAHFYPVCCDILHVHTVIYMGKEAANDAYNQSLQRITEKTGSR